MYKKPTLNKNIYILFMDELSIEKVIAKGTNIFIHTGCIDDGYVEKYRRPLRYDEYQDTWFSSLAEVRKYYKLKQIYKNYWEVTRK